MRILAVDPGLANTGVVLFADGRVHAVQTIRTPGDGRKTDWTKALARSSEIAVELSTAIERAHPDEIVCESYKDFGGGHLRVRDGKPVPNRWTTPLLIGYLHAAVFEDWQHSGITIVYQDPEVVMTLYRDHVRMWEDKRRGIAPGDDLITNEHLRSAAAHGLYRIATSRGPQ